MIPGVAEILRGLLTGQFTFEQCEEWINRHIELAAEQEGLRDHFAAMALQGILAQSLGTVGGSDPIHGAVMAYNFADAMLKARQA